MPTGFRLLSVFCTFAGRAARHFSDIHSDKLRPALSAAVWNAAQWSLGWLMFFRSVVMACLLKEASLNARPGCVLNYDCFASATTVRHSPILRPTARNIRLSIFASFSSFPVSQGLIMLIVAGVLIIVICLCGWCFVRLSELYTLSTSNRRVLHTI